LSEYKCDITKDGMWVSKFFRELAKLYLYENVNKQNICVWEGEDPESVAKHVRDNQIIKRVLTRSSE
jgi:hypothetical protein